MLTPAPAPSYLTLLSLFVVQYDIIYFVCRSQSKSTTTSIFQVVLKIVFRLVLFAELSARITGHWYLVTMPVATIKYGDNLAPRNTH